MKVAIIGAGVSGLVSAIIESKCNEVYIFEKNNTCCKKLLLTGSGKCNIGNEDNNICHYHSSNMDKLKSIINNKTINDARLFLESLGLVIKNKNGYLYPFSEKASSVKSLLENICLNNKVNFLYNSNINTIKKINDKFVINDMYFDKVIITTGGKSYEKTGSDGSGYNLAKSFNHNIIDPYPSLVGFKTNTGYEKMLAGIRCSAVLSLYVDKKFIKQETGELQFTKDGISGIAIFNLSRHIKKYLENKSRVEVGVNFIPWYTKDEVFNKNISITCMCDGFLDYKLSNVLLDILHIDKNISYNKLSDKDKNRFINLLSNYKINIIDTNSFNEAQVTSGGVDLSKVNEKTLESQLVNGLFFAGEVLDLDGDCGGYNLTIAIITGLIAGGFYDKN